MVANKNVLVHKNAADITRPQMYRSVMVIKLGLIDRGWFAVKMKVIEYE